jgi:hypothetical protein
LHEAHFPPQVRRDTKTDRDPLHSELQRAAVSVLYAPFYCDRQCHLDNVSHWYRDAMVRVRMSPLNDLGPAISTKRNQIAV